MSDIMTVNCPSFGEDGSIPIVHTGFDRDTSPEIQITNLPETTKSIAVIMDDLDVPFRKEYNHWLIWNLPPFSVIEGNIAYGAENENGARQGIGFGKNRYRGPKQPPFLRGAHRYRFTVYALDCSLELPTSAHKADLLKAMESHVLQSAEVTGWFKRP